MNDLPVKIILFANISSTLFMTGVIWFVQIVHYPLFASVSAGRFTDYERLHSERTSRVVIGPMIVELVTASILVWNAPDGIPAWQLGAGLTLVAAIWLSTFLLQVPAHSRLAKGFDDAVHRRLVLTNWFRTVAWSLRSLLSLAIVWNLIASA